MLKHIAWKDVELEQLNPLLDRQMITGDKLMLARVLLKKGCVVPEHSHENEQVTYILEGALKFWLGKEEIIVRAGEVLCIPSHVLHKAEAVEDTVSTSSIRRARIGSARVMNICAIHARSNLACFNTKRQNHLQ